MTGEHGRDVVEVLTADHREVEELIGRRLTCSPSQSGAPTASVVSRAVETSSSALFGVNAEPVPDRRGDASPDLRRRAQC